MCPKIWFNFTLNKFLLQAPHLFFCMPCLDIQGQMKFVMHEMPNTHEKNSPSQLFDTTAIKDAYFH